MRPIKSSLALITSTMMLCGCEAAALSPKPASKESPSAIQWVDSDDGLLALRFSVASRTVAAGEPIRVTSQLRNKSDRPITVLRPFGDSFAAEAIGLKVWDASRRVSYTGPALTYVIGANAFAVVAPGETIEDELELPNGNFAGIDTPGTYTLRYDFAYDGHWDSVAAVGDSGIRDAWRGTISSREIQVIRKPRR